MDPITPNSLLLGRPDHDLPQIVYPESELLSRKRWRHSQVLADHFWAHYVKRYLPELQTRNKWMTETGKTLKTGTVVMIVDHRLPRALWPVGKVSATVLGADGKIPSISHTHIPAGAKGMAIYSGHQTAPALPETQSKICWPFTTLEQINPVTYRL